MKRSGSGVFSPAHVPWWSIVLFFIALALILWSTDDFVRPAY